MGGQYRRLGLVGAGFAIMAAACSQAVVQTGTAPVDPEHVYDPIRAGEEPPRGYRQLLARNQIAPIYEPRFIGSGEVDWPDDSLVIGLAGDQSAKAYPVTHLNQREMVIDSLAGIPVLVTW